MAAYISFFGRASYVMADTVGFVVMRLDSGGRSGDRVC